MKYCFFLLLILWLLNPYDARSQPENKKTAAINKICRQIDADKSLKKVVAKADISHLYVHGSNRQLTGFYRDSTLIKMTLQGQDDEGKELFVYYYKNNALICVYNEFSGPHFNSTGQRVPHTYESNFQGWYYFRQGAWVYEESTGHNRFEDDELDATEILQKEAAECRRILP
ncbi:hypothetical protein [Chitinophaga sp. RAB17]|uniref:hypothetical protein n=1 Tax=Chitinophaga sp. RAB17 TaxID=3233049 RepID=UPI003F931C7B